MAIAEPDPTIRRRVLASGRRLIAVDPDVSVRRISADAGVSRATFYRHFGSRTALLRELDIPAASSSRERLLEAAAEMLQQRPLADMSMDELAGAAGVSRGTLYRLFPGKTALLRALVERYSPFDELLEVLATRSGEPPEVVVPELARAVARKAAPRVGVVRAILMETVSTPDESSAGVGPVLQRALGALGAYIGAQVAAGRLRPMHPLLAMQVIIGPVAFHLLTRPVAERVVRVDIDAETAADQLARAALHGLLA